MENADKAVTRNAWSLLSQVLNKKFWEELIAYFPRYDTGNIGNDGSNNSSIPYSGSPSLVQRVVTIEVYKV
jgi:hypothetical protein